jgi:hypothetical protein
MMKEPAPTNLDILNFENQHWKYWGNKEATIMRQFGLNYWQYCIRLNRIIRDPEAETTHPELVHRLLKKAEH